MTQEARAWLDGLKTGDEVALPAGGWDRTSVRIERVTHCTKTQIHVGHTKFRRIDGWPMGSNRFIGRIKEVTDEVRQKARHQVLSSWLVSLAANTEKLTLDQLEALHSAANAPKEPKQ